MNLHWKSEQRKNLNWKIFFIFPTMLPLPMWYIKRVECILRVSRSGFRESSQEENLVEKGHKLKDLTRGWQLNLKAMWIDAEIWVKGFTFEFLRPLTRQKQEKKFLYWEKFLGLFSKRKSIIIMCERAKAITFHKFNNMTIHCWRNFLLESIESASHSFSFSSIIRAL